MINRSAPQAEVLWQGYVLANFREISLMAVFFSKIHLAGMQRP